MSFEPPSVGCGILKLALEQVQTIMSETNIENVAFEPAPDNKRPKCPHCQAELETVWYKVSGAGLFGQSMVLMCPHCEAFLAYNAWKRM